MFKRPLDRFSASQSFFDPSPFYFDLNNRHPINSDRANFYMSKSQLKLELLSSSLEDIDQINYEPHMSLEFFNYVLALFLFALRYSSTLWHLNKTYAIVFSLHLILVSCLSLISFSSFEILYKFQSCFSAGIRLKINTVSKQPPTVANVNQTTSTITTTKNNTNLNSVLFNLPFGTGPTGLEISFFISMFLFLISAMPIYSYAIYQYKSKFRKLQYQFARFVTPNNYNFYEPDVLSHHHQCLSSSSSSSASTDQGACSESGNMDAPTVPLLNGTKLYEEEFNFNAKHLMVPAALPPPLPSQPPPTPLGQNAKRHKKIYKSDAALTPSLSTSSISPSAKHLNQNHRFNPADSASSTSSASMSLIRSDSSFFLIYKPYKSHLIALAILLVICFNSAVIVYDYICLYQLTSDTIPFWAAISYIVFILWYIFLWLVLTFKSKWSFEFKPLFKLAYWNFTNKHACNKKTSSSFFPDNINRATEMAALRMSRHSLANAKANAAASNRNNQIMSTSYTATTALTEYNEYDLTKKTPHTSYNMMFNKSGMTPNGGSLIHLKNNTSMSMTNLIGLNNECGNQSSMNVDNSNVASEALNSSQHEYSTDLTPYEHFMSGIY